MPKRLKLVLIALAIIAGCAWLWLQLTADQSTLRLHGVLYHAQIMRTDAELQKGLSGTDSLGADQAMLFVFPENYIPGIWMKDMKYPIDIVWLDDSEQVIYTVKNAQPSSYPQTFKPPTVARYVIELQSGMIDRTGIPNGDLVGLPSGLE